MDIRLWLCFTHRKYFSEAPKLSTEQTSFSPSSFLNFKRAVGTKAIPLPTMRLLREVKPPICSKHTEQSSNHAAYLVWASCCTNPPKKDNRLYIKVQNCTIKGEVHYLPLDYCNKEHDIAQTHQGSKSGSTYSKVHNIVSVHL